MTMAAVIATATTFLTHFYYRINNSIDAEAKVNYNEYYCTRTSSIICIIGQILR